MSRYKKSYKKSYRKKYNQGQDEIDEGYARETWRKSDKKDRALFGNSFKQYKKEYLNELKTMRRERAKKDTYLTGWLPNKRQANKEMSTYKKAGFKNLRIKSHVFTYGSTTKPKYKREYQVVRGG